MREVNLMKNVWLGAVAGAILLAGCGSGGGSTASGDTTGGTTTGSKAAGGSKGTIAFVTNNASDFWTIAHKGIDKAQGELPDYKLEFVVPQDGTAATQKSKLDDLVTNGVKGIAVSPVDPKNMTQDLDKYAAKAVLLTQDSDAPDSQRACYLGTDNVEAGKMAGEELKKALPNGGKIMVFVGKADAQNAKERYDGLKTAIAGSKITILDLRTDDTDHARAKQNVADALAKNEDLAGCVGLWSYNGPAIVNAVKEAKKVGKVQIVCFDEEDDTLAGIKDGSIFGTVVQNPFEFGYQTMKLIAKILDGDKSGIPENKKIIIPTRFIDKTSVDDFATTLKKLRGK